MNRTEHTHEVAETTKDDGATVRTETTRTDEAGTETQTVEHSADRDGKAKQVQPDGR